jgi:putative transposase
MRLCSWRSCVIVVRPETILRWHGAGWRLFWRYKSRPGRPRVPRAGAATAHSTDGEGEPIVGEERIANELLVSWAYAFRQGQSGKYMSVRPSGQPRGDQRCSTFLKNHAKGILSCDFFVAVTATFRMMLYVFVVIAHSTRHLESARLAVRIPRKWAVIEITRHSRPREYYVAMHYNAVYILLHYIACPRLRAGELIWPVTLRAK